MATQDIFLSLVTNRANVAADKAKIETDTAMQASDQSALNSDVATNGAALVFDGEGKPFAVLPPAAGATDVQEVSLRDGKADPTPPPVNPPANP